MQEGYKARSMLHLHQGEALVRSLHARTVDEVRSPYREITEKAIQAAKRGRAEEAAEILTQYFYGEITKKEAEKKLRALAEAR